MFCAKKLTRKPRAGRVNERLPNMGGSWSVPPRGPCHSPLWFPHQATLTLKRLACRGCSPASTKSGTTLTMITALHAPTAPLPHRGGPSPTAPRLSDTHRYTQSPLDAQGGWVPGPTSGTKTQHAHVPYSKGIVPLTPFPTQQSKITRDF